MAAAVSVAVDAQRAADLAAQERERYAMRAADLECLMAQRMFMEDLLLPQRFQPTTYEVGYTLRHNALVESHDAMRTVHSMLLRGRVSRALQVAEEELGGPPDAEGAESESSDNDEPVQDLVVQRRLAAAASGLMVPSPVFDTVPDLACLREKQALFVSHL